MTQAAHSLVQAHCGDIPSAKKAAMTRAINLTRKWLVKNPGVLKKEGARCEEAVFWFDVARELE